MKYIILTWLCFASFICIGQPTILLTKGEEVKEIPIYSEFINGHLIYECSFDRVYDLEQEGWTVAEYEEGLVNSRYYRVAYLAYSLIKDGVDYFTVIELLDVDEQFYPTLYWIGCHSYNFEQ